VASPDQTYFPTYILDGYELIAAHLALYDETNDGRQLLRALRVGCERLQQLEADSGFWDLLSGYPGSSDTLQRPNDLDGWLGELLDAERQLLTQAGMAPRAVAVLLHEVELCIRAWSDNSNVPSVSELRDAVVDLANATCQEWERLRSRLQPIIPPGPEPLPSVSDLPSRLPPFVRRAGIVLGGSAMAAANLAIAAHFPPLTPLAEVSVQAGARLIWAGGRGRGR
jgi:hypothetical protein